MEAKAAKSSPPETALFSDYIARNLPELIEGLSPEIPIEEKLVEEVMQELYKEFTTGGFTTKPSSTAECFPAKSLFTGNEKSESCGAFVSDSASSVMAGIGFVGYAGKMVGSPENGGWSEWRSNLGEGGSVVEKAGMDGCDHAAEVMVDDEWIERVLSTWGPVDLESWF